MTPSCFSYLVVLPLCIPPAIPVFLGSDVEPPPPRLPGISPAIPVFLGTDEEEDGPPPLLPEIPPAIPVFRGTETPLPGAIPVFRGEDFELPGNLRRTELSTKKGLPGLTDTSGEVLRRRCALKDRRISTRATRLKIRRLTWRRCSY